MVLQLWLAPPDARLGHSLASGATAFELEGATVAGELSALARLRGHRAHRQATRTLLLVGGGGSVRVHLDYPTAWSNALIYVDAWAAWTTQHGGPKAPLGESDGRRLAFDAQRQARRGRTSEIPPRAYGKASLVAPDIDSEAIS